VIEADELCVRQSPPLWLWTAASRSVGQVLGFSLGDRSDAELAWLWTDVPASYQHAPVCSDHWGAYSRFFAGRGQAHEGCDKGSGKGSGKTSRIEALNCKWRQRQSGLVRKSCGIWDGMRDDVVERFMILAEEHNRQVIARYERKKRLSTTTMGSP